MEVVEQRLELGDHRRIYGADYHCDASDDAAKPNERDVRRFRPGLFDEVDRDKRRGRVKCRVKARHDRCDKRGEDKSAEADR